MLNFLEFITWEVLCCENKAVSEVVNCIFGCVGHVILISML